MAHGWIHQVPDYSMANDDDRCVESCYHKWTCSIPQSIAQERLLMAKINTYHNHSDKSRWLLALYSNELATIGNILDREQGIN